MSYVTGAVYLDRDWSASGSSRVFYGTPGSFIISGTSNSNRYEEVPDVWRCAYCSQLQSKTKDVIIRAHKIQEHVHKCSVCGAPKTEMKNG